jgi:hypothetical protein
VVLGSCNYIKPLLGYLGVVLNPLGVLHPWGSFIWELLIHLFFHFLILSHSCALGLGMETNGWR